MKDITNWGRSGYGGKSTLEKEELINPLSGERYLIKYPRKFNVGVSWEDITELVAAKIGNLLGLEMMEVEIVIRENRQGCLLKNFIPKGMMNEEGGALLSMFDSYAELLNSELEGEKLIKQGFALIESLSYWDQIKKDFIEMNFFDILIGNQDRHPYNWMVLFKSASEQKFSTIYDNGASLGFRFDDQQLHTYVSDPNKLEKYMRKSTVKGGLFERKRVKSLEMAKYLYTHYRIESQEIIDRIKHFEFEQFNGFIDSQNVLTEMQKEWLKVIVSFRSQTLLKWLQEEE